MMSYIHTQTDHHCKLTVHVVGGGISGMMIAMDLIELGHVLGLPIAARVYEACSFGGGHDDRVAGSRCQLWLHTDGQLFALGQPAVCRALQASTWRLRQFAPHAFSYPPALVIDPQPADRPPLSTFYQAAQVPFRTVETAVAKHWQPSFRLRPDDHVYAVTDATIDLTLLSHTLALRARKMGVALLRQRIDHLILRGSKVQALGCADDMPLTLGSNDHVVLACGANIRPLLAKNHLTIPGLRHFKSHLIATDSIGLDLLAVIYGGINCVPHRGKDGRIINIFGDTNRSEVSADYDGRPLTIEDQASAALRKAAAEWFGIHIPAKSPVWSAIKTEIVPEVGKRSQGHHTHLVPGLENCWLSLPGKLSQSASASWDLARLILRSLLSDEISQPIWQRPPLPQRQSDLLEELQAA